MIPPQTPTFLLRELLEGVIADSLLQVITRGAATRTISSEPPVLRTLWPAGSPSTRRHLRKETEMNLAEARKLESQHPEPTVELHPTELDELERMSVDEVTTLLQRRYRRFLACGCDHRRALFLAVGLS